MESEISGLKSDGSFYGFTIKTLIESSGKYYLKARWKGGLFLMGWNGCLYGYTIKTMDWKEGAFCWDRKLWMESDGRLKGDF